MTEINDRMTVLLVGGISLITPLSTRRGVGGEAVCWALPHFHKHLFSFRYCLRHHLNECQHTAGRVQHIAFASVESGEDTSPCIFGLIPCMNPYPLKSLHVQQQRQPSSEPSAACDEDAVTPRWDSRLPDYLMPTDDC